jgi:DNA-binding transcriptional MerR regulator
MSTHLLSQGEAATLLGLSPRTLERYRCTGFGPSFIKAGRRVLYRQSDLEDWIAARRCQSTSQSYPTVGQILDQLTTEEAGQ